MMSTTRAFGAVRLAAMVMLLAGCLWEPVPDCEYTDCGTVAGSVVGLSSDGVQRWRVPTRDAKVHVFHDPSLTAPGPILVTSGNLVAVDGCRAVHVIDATSGRTLLETDRLTTVWLLADGLVVGTRDEAFVAIPLDNASQGWELTHDGNHGAEIPTGAARVGNTTVVAWPSAVGLVEPNGNHRIVELSSAATGPPVAVDDTTALLPTVDGITSLDVNSGSVGWTLTPKRPREFLTTRLFPLEEDVLVAFEGSAEIPELVRVGRTGQEKWRVEAELPDRVALSADASTVLARVRTSWGPLDLRTGELQYVGSRVPSSDESISTGTGLVVSAGRARPVSAHPSATGWTEDAAWQVIGRPEGLAGDLVVVQDGTTNALHAVDPSSGKVRWTMPVEHVWRTYGEGAVHGPRDRAVMLANGTSVVLDLPAELMRLRGCDEPGSRHTVDDLPPDEN
jgi:hypothetical protein